MPKLLSLGSTGCREFRLSCGRYHLCRLRQFGSRAALFRAHVRSLVVIESSRLS
jgi:hypothetical protein